VIAHDDVSELSRDAIGIEVLCDAAIDDDGGNRQATNQCDATQMVEAMSLTAHGASPEKATARQQQHAPHRVSMSGLLLGAVQKVIGDTHVPNEQHRDPVAD
jgi:hypothetical protein